MMNGRLFLGRLRPRRLTWTLLVGMIMMFALSSSANEFHKQQQEAAREGPPPETHKIHIDYCHG
jgi:hypothetical protein